MADIKSHASLTTGLVSYWDLEEASGTRYDLHGSNNLTDNNTVTSAAGKIGNAALFTSANSEYLSITDASQTGLEPSGNMSWSFWVYFNSVPGAGSGATFLGKGDGNQKYQIHYSGNGEGIRLLFYPSSGTYKGVDHAWTPSTSTWYHIVITFNSTASTNNFQIFINNSKTSRTGASAPCGSISGNTNPFIIGANTESPTTYFMNGRIEEVGMWGKVLSDAEVSDLYNSGNGLSYADTAGGGAVNSGFFAFM